jgi:hypothetical protein
MGYRFCSTDDVIALWTFDGDGHCPPLPGRSLTPFR